MTHDDLTTRLAGLARDLRSQVGSADTAQAICEAAVHWVDGDIDAVITLVHRRHRLDTVAATSEAARRSDALQYELSEGPCLDAAWEQQQVYCADLRAERRWPNWGPRVAGELGVGSLLCTRLFTNETMLGALSLYARHEDAFDPDDHDDVRALAAHAAVAVAASQQIETLKVAVDRRTTIGKALGIVMERYGLDDDTAFQLLTRLSSDSNRKLYDIAEQVLRTRAIPA